MCVQSSKNTRAPRVPDDLEEDVYSCLDKLPENQWITNYPPRKVCRATLVNFPRQAKFSSKLKRLIENL